MTSAHPVLSFLSETAQVLYWEDLDLFSVFWFCSTQHTGCLQRHTPVSGSQAHRCKHQLNTENTTGQNLLSFFGFFFILPVRVHPSERTCQLMSEEGKRRQQRKNKQKINPRVRICASSSPSLSNSSLYPLPSLPGQSFSARLAERAHSLCSPSPRVRVHVCVWARGRVASESVRVLRRLIGGFLFQSNHFPILDFFFFSFPFLRLFYILLILCSVFFFKSSSYCKPWPGLKMLPLTIWSQASLSVNKLSHELSGEFYWNSQQIIIVRLLTTDSLLESTQLKMTAIANWTQKT